MTTETHSPYNFAHLGVSPEVEANFAECVHTNNAELARIVRVDRGLPLATSASGTYRAELAEKAAKRARKNALLRPAVGDWVALAHPAEHDVAIIEKILPRTGSFTRRDPGEQANEQVIIANVDIVFVVQALCGDRHGISLARIERELVLAFESGAQPYLVLTKADLCADPKEEARFAAAATGWVPIIIESAITGLGIEEIRSLVPKGITAAMIGASGVGKSTLINRLVGDEALATAEVRARDDKGRHTTVAREIVELPEGGVMIDTPGMRSIALWQADTGMALTFPEITEAAESCKFADCRHKNEPACAVHAAIQSGAIDPDRLSRYQVLATELDALAQKRKESNWH
jgi:ribosome biogenesis GTPase